MAISIPNNESIQHIIRKHWFDLFVHIVPIIILIVVMAMGGYIFLLYAQNAIALITTEVYIFYISATLFYGWLFMFIAWLNYSLDVWIVTKRRVLDIEQHSLFSRDVSEIRLDKVQDITVTVSGIFPTLFGFGDLHIQTAGAIREFIIRNISNPYIARNIISSKVEELTREETK